MKDKVAKTKTKKTTWSNQIASSGQTAEKHLGESRQIKRDYEMMLCEWINMI